MGECLSQQPVLYFNVWLWYYTYFKSKLLFDLKGRRIFVFFIKILTSLIFGLGCISRNPSLRTSDHAIQTLPCTLTSMPCFLHCRLCLFIAIWSFGKEPLLPCPHVKPESTFITYFSSFFGQTEHLNSFQIDAWEKKTLNQNPLLRMKSFLEGHFFKIYFFFSFIFISWRLITLQYCSGFCHTLTWISHGFTCVPHPDPPSHLPPHLMKAIFIKNTL